MAILFLFLNAQNNNNFLKLRFMSKKSLVNNRGFFASEYTDLRL